MTFCLRLLGSPTLEHAGELRSMALERRNQLLVYLALKQSWVTRAELASLLWPELETRLAYTNLRKILFRLQPLAWSDRIETQAGALDCGNVQKHVLAARRRLDEAEAFGGVEPFHGAIGHFSVSLQSAREMQRFGSVTTKSRTEA